MQVAELRATLVSQMMKEEILWYPTLHTPIHSTFRLHAQSGHETANSDSYQDLSSTPKITLLYTLNQLKIHPPAFTYKQLYNNLQCDNHW